MSFSLDDVTFARKQFVERKVDVACLWEPEVTLALTSRPGMMASPTAVRRARTSAAFSERPVGAGMYAVEGTWHPRESM